MMVENNPCAMIHDWMIDGDRVRISTATGHLAFYAAEDGSIIVRATKPQPGHFPATLVGYFYEWRT